MQKVYRPAEKFHHINENFMTRSLYNCSKTDITVSFLASLFGRVIGKNVLRAECVLKLNLMNTQHWILNVTKTKIDFGLNWLVNLNFHRSLINYGVFIC